MYLMSYFHPDEREGMFLAYSDDLLNWTTLNDEKPLFVPEEGYVLRDPFLIRDKEGVYHMLYTDNWKSRTIGHTSSNDLIHWEKADHLPLMTHNDDALNCWAPEAFYDREKDAYRIIFSSASASIGWDTSNRIWTALTKDFREITDVRMFLEPGYCCIDATVLIEEDGYKMAFKDERGFNRPDTDFKAIRTCTFKDADSGCENISDLITSNLSEGPCLVKKDGMYYMFFDSFGCGAYGVMVSSDFVNWEDHTAQASFPPHCRHMGIIECDPAVIEKLK